MRDMLGRSELIAVEQALDLMLHSSPLRTPDEIEITIEEAHRCILSRDIFSPEDLPHFTKSTVDGYAVRASDTFGATEGFPSYLKIKDEVHMGEVPLFSITKGETAKIATGGMLPDGSDSVVMLEHTQLIDETTIEVVKPASPGGHVIQIGEDVKKGECILEKGTRLKPQDIGVLAGLGITSMKVFRKPTVSIIGTGDEIVLPEKTLAPGQVRDINSYTLSGLIQDAGGTAQRKGIFKDEYLSIKGIMEKCLKDSHMILITGGSSVGSKDLTEKVINDGGEPGVLFHGVSLKPGKPTIGGIVKHVPVFGLPGHPAAIVICFKLLVQPVLHRIAGLHVHKKYEITKNIRARISKNISSSPGREEHIGVTLEERAGEMWATPLLGKSGLITTLSQADGTAVIPLNKLGVHEGDFVDVQLF